MFKTPTDQQHTSNDNGKTSASDSARDVCEFHSRLYNRMIDLSLGSLSGFHSTATFPSSEHLHLQPPPRARQSLSLPPPEFSPAAALHLLPSSSSSSDHHPRASPEFSPAAALPLLASPPAPARRYQPRQSISYPPALGVARSSSSSSTKQRKKNSSSSLRLKKGKSETITPPYEWATNRRATVHSLVYLDSKKIYEIKGDVQCRRCESQYLMEFNLIKKFSEVAKFIWLNKGEMAERAPDFWMNPTLPTCRFCGQENSVKPVIPRSKKAINWLFLLLGQMLGCCTLNQLRYFCKYRRHHRTGAKDRVLYLTYLNLCKQLDPTGPFDR